MHHLTFRTIIKSYVNCYRCRKATLGFSNTWLHRRRGTRLLFINKSTGRNSTETCSLVPPKFSLESTPNAAFYTYPCFARRNCSDYQANQNQQSRHSACNMHWYRCGSTDHLIGNCPEKPHTYGMSSKSRWKTLQPVPLRTP